MGREIRRMQIARAEKALPKPPERLGYPPRYRIYTEHHRNCQLSPSPSTHTNSSYIHTPTLIIMPSLATCAHRVATAPRFALQTVFPYPQHLSIAGAIIAGTTAEGLYNFVSIRPSGTSQLGVLQPDPIVLVTSVCLQPDHKTRHLKKGHHGCEGTDA